ncbi:hypothetical protein [Kitasatospora sp. NPDC056184]|uniref:hypothetical protein n=1 Tax=Kitasatospora sp. NPDC056184 TaxID=3345738 RepID=UPI0035DE9640
MSRALNADEQEVLEALIGRVERIVSLGTAVELAGTTVLSGPGPAPDYTLFHQRFAVLGHRMRELRFVVREDLPDTTGASAVISDGPFPSVLEVQLRPGMVGPGTRTLTARALTLVHELSHGLKEGLTHPVKDYAYRTGWAWGHLPAVLAQDNADTYAEAAALLAERDEGAWGQYQVLGRVAAQRGRLLRREGVTTLGSALAWLDIVVNRAWVRASDCAAFAGVAFGEARWNTPEWSVWQHHAPLLALEQWLELWGFIGERRPRDGAVGLGAEDRGTVAELFGYLSELKHAVDRIDPVPAEEGDRIAYDLASGALRIPRSVVNRGPLALANLVLGALVEATAARPAAERFGRRGREVVHALVGEDRWEEREAVATLRTAFAGIPAVQPSADQWATLAVELQAAVLEDVRTRWEGLSRYIPVVAGMPEEVDRKVLGELAGAFGEDVDLLHTLNGRMPVPRPLVTGLIGTLTAVTPYLVKAEERQQAELVALEARLRKLL